MHRYYPSPPTNHSLSSRVSKISHPTSSTYPIRVSGVSQISYTQPLHTPPTQYKNFPVTSHPIRASTIRASNVSSSKVISHPISRPLINSLPVSQPLPPQQFNPPVIQTPKPSDPFDKDIKTIGRYQYQDERITTSPQEFNPRKEVESVSGKVLQTTVMDSIPTEIFKVSSQSQQDKMRDSQTDFMATSSLTSTVKSNGLSSSRLTDSGILIKKKSDSLISLGMNGRVLGEGIKVSVYRSPDVVIREPEMMDEGPKLSKDHVLRVSVKGKHIPNDRYSSKQTLPTIHEVIDRNDSSPQQHRPTIPVVSSSESPYQLSRNQVHPMTSPSTTPVQPRRQSSNTFYGNEYINPHIHTHVDNNPTPIKTLAVSSAYSDSSAIKQLTSTLTGEFESESSRRPFFSTNGDYTEFNLPHDILEGEVDGCLPQTGEPPKSTGKLPQSKISHPLSFKGAPMTYTTLSTAPTPPAANRDSSSVQVSYPGPPRRANDPQRILLD